MQIENSVVFLTGGSSGIGKETAKQLVAKGAIVYITGRESQKLKSVAAEIGAHPLQVNMNSDEELQSGLNQIINEQGHLDVLINNAGIGSFGPVESLSREDFRRIFEVNVFGAGILGSMAAKHFKERKKGHIVNIGSSASLKGFPNGSVYSASKFALRALSECWRAELRPFNVRVTHVNPSEVTTAFFQEDRVEREEQANKLRALEIAQMIVACLELDDRGFVPEFGVWATNPF
jgi:3-oxoacyl-[acyl-carrier protein] reductase